MSLAFRTPLAAGAAFALLMTAGAPAGAAGDREATAAPPAASLPAASSPAAAPRSAFDGYRRYADEPVGSWRAANDQVGRIGGWKAYAREAAEAEPAQAPSASPRPSQPPASGSPSAAPSVPATPQPAENAHGSHHKH